jgi:hypothetical protein
MIKILVVSDTHGQIEHAVECIKKEGPYDRMIHLGDQVEDAVRLANWLGIEQLDVCAGNCDYPSEGVSEKILNIDGVTIFMTHGHKYGVKFTLDRLYYRAKEVGAKIALYGHTHQRRMVEERGVTLFNPGSLSLPRDWKIKRKSFGTILIEEGRFHLEYKYLK